jgi:cellulose synthase/poly-beta-1,6-N-acetylglucosamine synthase-like glycosyltransferase
MVSPRKRKSQNIAAKVAFAKLWRVWWVVLWWIVYGYFLWRWRPREVREEAPAPKEATEGYFHTEDFAERTLSVSILIPVRNEAGGLSRLLETLEKESFPILEVLIIDDHSTDGTAQVIEAWRSRMRFPMYYLENAGIGKKAALLTGLRAARGEIIVTLDADTVPEKGALERLVRPFCSPAVQMSAAYVRFWDGAAYSQGDFWRQFLLAFQALEMAGILALTAGSWQRGEPLTVNGAFLAYRREAFEAVGGWGSAPHPGGDDEFLMRRIYQRYGAAALVFSGAVAETRPALSWSEFWHQRRRWLSKERYAPLSLTQAGLLLLGLTHLLFWGLLFYSPTWAIAHLIVTGLLQASIIEAGRRAMKLPATLWAWYGLAQLWYPIYVVALGILLWKREFQWRGRKYKTR